MPVASMNIATKLFHNRLAKLESEIDDLRREQAMIVRFQTLLGAYEHVLRADDHFSPRTSAKFELLARVVKYLLEPDQFLYGGAGTREIFDALTKEISLDKRRVDNFNSDPERRERGQAQIVSTPLEAVAAELNYNTFRSYMKRFRDEGRIFFNEDKRRWRVAEKNIVSEYSPSDEEQFDDRWQ